MLGFGLSIFQTAIRNFVTLGGGSGDSYTPTYHIYGF